MANQETESEVIFSGCHAFLDTIIGSAQQAGIELDGAFIDHVGYRTTKLSDYYTKQAQVATIATLLGEPIISGRPISVFAFREPLLHGDFRIPYFELIAPSPVSETHQEGFEHIEVVVGDPLGMPAQHPNLEWRVAPGRTINPEAKVRLGEYTIKFHPLPVADAMREQLAKGML